MDAPKLNSGKKQSPRNRNWHNRSLTNSNHDDSGIYEGESSEALKVKSPKKGKGKSPRKSKATRELEANGLMIKQEHSRAVSSTSRENRKPQFSQVDSTAPTVGVKRSKVRRARSKSGVSPAPKKAKKSRTKAGNSAAESSSQESEEMKDRRSKEGASPYVPPHARDETKKEEQKKVQKGCCEDEDEAFHQKVDKLHLEEGRLNGGCDQMQNSSGSGSQAGDNKASFFNKNREKAPRIEPQTSNTTRMQPQPNSHKKTVNVNVSTDKEWRKQKNADRFGDKGDYSCVQPLPKDEDRASSTGMGTWTPVNSIKEKEVSTPRTPSVVHNTRYSKEQRRSTPFHSGLAELEASRKELFNESDVYFYDSHCHLDFIYDQVNKDDKVDLNHWMGKYKEFFPANFKGCIPNFIYPELFTPIHQNEYDIDWIKRQVQDKYVLGATYGCHPHKADIYCDEVKNSLKNICTDRDTFKIIAIGECGLDYYKSKSDRENQKKAFTDQLDLAKNFGLPIVIHCRPSNGKDAEEDCLHIMKGSICRFHNIHRHCYTGDWNTADMWLKQHPNTYFGFTNAAATFSQNQKDVIRNLKLDRILLETDAPYFRPKIFDMGNYDKICFPGMAIATAKLIAELKDIPLATVLKQTTRNVERCYVIGY